MAELAAKTRAVMIRLGCKCSKWTQKMFWKVRQGEAMVVVLQPELLGLFVCCDVIADVDEVIGNHAESYPSLYSTKIFVA
jgi:hypothetical protein